LNTLPGMPAQRATAVDQVADAKSSTSVIESDSDNDSDYSLPSTEASSSTPKGPIQNRLHLGWVAKLSDRYVVSDRAAAALVSFCTGGRRRNTFTRYFHGYRQE
jgi:hypothetical protein